MTHELKTPISTISLACEALNDKGIANSKETQGRFVNMINEENKRLGVLVENVLQSAVIDKGELQLQREFFNIQDVIQRAVKNVKIQVEKKGGQIVVSKLGTTVQVYADKVHITNVIYNLLDNANKYTPIQPSIKISTEEIVGGIVIKVKDNGVGISKENQKKIFEKLYRVPTGNVHDVKGFGLGLSYVKAIVEKHNGTINVDSTLGKGSAFVLTLPIEKEKNHE
jgi:two-component system, OmpR family, phosphate regulon sensor histidine kinase PhoR